MRKAKIVALAIVGVLLIAGLVYFVGWAIYMFFRYISSVPKELGAALVAAAATVLVATATVMIGRYYERRKELDTLYRDKKTEIYNEFLNIFLGLFFNKTNDQPQDVEKDLVPYLRDFTQKLILWSGPEVIEAFLAWKDHLTKGTPDANSIFLTESFLLAIRKDLGHTNIGLRKGFFARLFLREGTLFLTMAEKNPNITLSALIEIENAIKAQSSTDGT